MNGLREQIIQTGRRMLADNLTIGAWGNISARDADGNVCITPSGMAYDRLVPEDIICMDIEGNILTGERKPSIETMLHLLVYRTRPDCRAIVHTHPIYSTAFSVMGEDIPLILDEAAQQLGDTVRTAEYALPGTMELAENCVRALGAKSMACLLKAHGAVCLGENLEQAYLISKVLESTARIYSLVRSMGGQAAPLPEANIAAMQDFMKNRYGQR